MRLWVRPLASLSGLRFRCCCELWCRSQMQLRSCIALWLWCRPGATALIRPLAWEPPYAVGAALKRPKKKQKTKTKKLRGQKHIQQNQQAHGELCSGTQGSLIVWIFPHGEAQLQFSKGHQRFLNVVVPPGRNWRH